MNNANINQVNEIAQLNDEMLDQVNGGIGVALAGVVVMGGSMIAIGIGCVTAGFVDMFKEYREYKKKNRAR